MRKVLAFVFLTFLAVSAWATTMLCNIDKMTLYFAGETKVESGTLLYLHKCGQGHRFWLTSEQMNK